MVTFGTRVPHAWVDFFTLLKPGAVEVYSLGALLVKWYLSLHVTKQLYTLYALLCSDDWISITCHYHSCGKEPRHNSGGQQPIVPSYCCHTAATTWLHLLCSVQRNSTSQQQTEVHLFWRSDNRQIRVRVFAGLEQTVNIVRSGSNCAR